ncbi:MAG: hypothetical protein DRO98_03820 [Archaeoglobales archaeon]|nr:MAG: hypothetical protein DRO98_03820 [Archaeoglobales archaeon]
MSDKSHSSSSNSNISSSSSSNSSGSSPSSISSASLPSLTLTTGSKIVVRACFTMLLYSSRSGLYICHARIASSLLFFSIAFILLRVSFAVS